MKPDDFDVLQESGVTQTEFAFILGVSRVTVNRWTQGVAPTPYLIRASSKLLTEIKSAVDLGLLPGPLVDLTPSRYTVEERRQVIDDALREVRHGQVDE